ncbi:MAG: NUDIX domain-containing protein [Kofleriaceae bacterium]
MTTPLREAASVILLRRGPKRDVGGPPFEVFLLRRRKGASFMASAFVFPGGGAEGTEDARTCAARELFEEAGILLVREKERSAEPFAEESMNQTLGDETPAFSIASLRKKVLAGANATDLLTQYELRWWTDCLIPWSHWITPSIESKRFSARFFVCELPGGQKPSYDGDETVDEMWVSPAEAIVRAGELSLPPPQLRTMYELASLSSIQDVLAAAKVRAEEPHPILPRLRTMQPGANGPTLLLPWDPEYGEQGTGDSAPLTYVPSWATGPSRFVLDAGASGDAGVANVRAWQHIDAPR